jgi:hypothetical protein
VVIVSVFMILITTRWIWTYSESSAFSAEKYLHTHILISQFVKIILAFPCIPWCLVDLSDGEF